MRVIAMLMGIRFLTDYLAGDVYYHIAKPNHNLIRARTLIALLRSIADQRAEIEDITMKAFDGEGLSV
jgi:N-acetylhexosamine 1-kinase